MQVNKTKAQIEFESKSKSFVGYIKKNNIKISDKILDSKYRSYCRLIDGEGISVDIYKDIINIIEASSKKKVNSKIPYQILNKFKLNEKINRSEIITFEFQSKEHFTDYIYGVWEQEQEEQIDKYETRFLEFMDKEDKEFLKDKTITWGMNQSIIPKCELKLQKDHKIKENISLLLNNFITPSYRYGFAPNMQWSLSARAFLESDAEPCLDYLFKKNVKISIGYKFCPQKIIFPHLQKHEIFLNAKFIWIIKFGDPKTMELSNLYNEEQIFKEFKKRVLSKK